MKKGIKRIGILTGGGDCPALNAVIRASVKSALNRGWEVIGIKNSFEGFFNPGLIKKIYADDVAGILHIGGTILGTSSGGDPLLKKIKIKGKEVLCDRSGQIVREFKKLKLDALIVIGGDGTLKIAKKLYDKGIPLVGVPKTIDNDLSATVMTFGFDTAVSVATDAIDKLHPTTQSHQRVMVVEVMGRYAGWIALNSGVSGGADVILIPEIPFDIKKVCKKVEDRYKIGRNFCIVVAAEGAKYKGAGVMVKEKSTAGRVEVLGGIAQRIADDIQKLTGRSTRSIVLGHLQRGGHPTTFDRLLATRFGTAAVRLVAGGGFGRMVCLRPPDIESVTLEEAISKMKQVPLDSDVIASARELGISFGD